MAGKASSVATAPSSWRPPWFDTTTPSQPTDTARSASSGRSTPFSRSLPGHWSRSCFTYSQLIPASISRPTAVTMSVPAGVLKR